MRVPVISLIILFLFSFLVDWYIWSDIRKYASQKHRKTYGIVYAVLSALLWIYLIVVVCLPRRDVGESITPVMWMLFSYFTVYISKFVYMVCSLIGRLFRKHVNYGAYIGIGLGLLTGFSMMWGALVTRYDIEVTHADIYSDRLPKGFDNFKIVQFSDAHVGTWGNDTTFISALVDSINAQQPDVIFFTGDIVNRITSELDPFVKPLSRLHAPYGVYSILGNHDYGDYADWESEEEHRNNNQRLYRMQEQMGWKMLNNDSEIIRANGDSIVIIGVENWGEPPFKVYGDLKKAYPRIRADKHLNDGNFKILLTHNPEHWRQEVTKKSNIDLTLSGHTHAMQSMIKVGGFKWSPSSFKYENWGGLYDADNGKPMQIYVNIGSGEVGFPSRVGAAYPEVTVLTLKRKK